MKRTDRFSISYCICPNCKGKFPIPRKGGATREKKHIKTIWCPFCKEKTDMMEIRENDFYKDGSGCIIGRYKEKEEVEEKETYYINKIDLMECPEMYEFDFR